MGGTEKGGGRGNCFQDGMHETIKTKKKKRKRIRGGSQV